MADKKPIPLVGRLAIQLKMLTSEEVDRAIAESVSSGNPRLLQVFHTMGLLDAKQIGKIQHVQQDLVDKHRAKKDAEEAGGAAKPAAGSNPHPAPAEIHAAAEHSAATAAPVAGPDVEAMREPPAKAAAPDTGQPATPSVSTQSKPAPAQSPPPQSAAAVPHPGKVIVATGKDSLELPVPEPAGADREKLEAILREGTAQKASDIHLHAGGALRTRVNGEFLVSENSFDAHAIERMVAASLTPEQHQILSRDGELDYCFDLPGIGRFRANAYRQQRGLDAVFRTIPDTPPTLADLGLPDDLKKHTDYHQGMFLITGPAGCGKSATLAALVNHINENRNDHILTVEDPIEIIHPSKQCLVNQRHAGHHTVSFARALRGALREDPDIIVIGELRDLETIRLAMTAAETGHFVLATLHTANAVRTVNRMIGAFPSNEQDQVRAMLSESLRAVLSQRLVRTADGLSRVPALELLVINRAIGNLIRDEKTVQIRSSMLTGKTHGMYLLEQSLSDLVAAGKITREVALEMAEEQKLITAGA
jgi:twitching motility protein PilT